MSGPYAREKYRHLALFAAQRASGHDQHLIAKREEARAALDELDRLGAIADAAREWAEGWYPMEPDPVAHGTNLCALYDLIIHSPHSVRLDRAFGPVQEASSE